MSYETETEFPRLLDDDCTDVIKCKIEYEVRHDCDPYDVGEATIWRSYTYVEVIKTSYFLNNKEYQPTDYELSHWENEVEDLAKENYEECVA